MKKRLRITAVLALALVLSANTVYAGPLRTFTYSGAVKQEEEPAKEPDKPEIKIAEVSHIGLPVRAIQHRDPKTWEIYYTYEGEKKFTFDITTPGVSLSASSSDRKMEARARESYLYLESDSLRPGDTANVTLTATHKSLPAKTLEIKITVTDGSAAYPHIVSGRDDFLSIPSLGLNGRYVQEADFSLEGISEWSPIGRKELPFEGVYDGKGHKITGMEFKQVDGDFPGLFGVVGGKAARISRINLEGKIDSLYYYAGSHGSIVGLVDSGTVSDCSFKGDLTFRNSAIRAGGIAAEIKNGGVIKNSRYTGKIKVEGNSNRAYVGGIVGMLNGTAEDCSFNGEIVYEGTREPNVGGIAGLNKGVISGCSVNADISQYGAVSYIGGIAGYNYTEIKDSAYSGKIYLKGDEIWAGGITGASVGSVTGCAVKGTISYNGNGSYIGGAVGRIENSVIEKTSCEADITGQGLQCRVGGITGENYSFINAENMKTKGKLLASVSGCAFYGNISIKGNASWAGGIAGRNYGYTMVSGAAPDKAGSVIEKCAVGKGNIAAAEGVKAGRVAADSLVESSGYKGLKVHSAVLSDNCANSGVTLNGAKAAENVSADGINGADVSDEGLAAFLERFGINPAGAELLK